MKHFIHDHVDKCNNAWLDLTIKGTQLLFPISHAPCCCDLETHNH